MAVITSTATIPKPRSAALSRRNRRQTWVHCPAIAEPGARAAAISIALACSELSAAIHQPHRRSTRLATASRHLSVLDARIELHEQDVQRQVNQGENRGDEQHRGAQDWIVALPDRLDDQEPDARPGEDGL